MKNQTKLALSLCLTALDFLTALCVWYIGLGISYFQSYLVPVSLEVGRAGLGQVFGLVLLFFIFGNALQVCRPGIL